MAYLTTKCLGKNMKIRYWFGVALGNDVRRGRGGKVTFNKMRSAVALGCGKWVRR